MKSIKPLVDITRMERKIIMHVSVLNIAIVVTSIIMLPDLLAASIRLCRKALGNRSARKA
jgi:hypothetical protein